MSSSKQHAPVKTLNQILTAEHSNLDTDISALENEIDQIVYSLYNLTPEAIAIVEAKL